MIAVKWSPSCCHPNLCFKVFAVQYPATLAIIIIIIITITQCQPPCPRYYILPRQWTANRDRVPFPDFHPQGKILIAKRLKSRVMLSKKKMFIGNWQCLPNCCVLLWWCLVVPWWCQKEMVGISDGDNSSHCPLCGFGGSSIQCPSNCKQEANKAPLHQSLIASSPSCVSDSLILKSHNCFCCIPQNARYCPLC